ncbi:MAG: hypothetical protein V1768_03375 [Patescibacteria group bacterium]|nr:hypothetical protein [Patescibacteria group bacterium]MBU1684465.1 hypothetical protein [Patescibacteria group bacterium]MBU1987383.1 hypothetical protein [Patescibacteria group bacterium]MBU2416280.1 hypothetical protein [Patescibacteria group bacterium]MBU2474524.1 hypothetical protein [Patescibacteria group bacterium]
MINKKFFQKLKKDYGKQESERQQIISLSNIVLHDSKRVIFALHRGDIKKANKQFVEIENIIVKKLEKNFGYQRIIQEGSYRAAVEEYVEAKMFYFVITNEKINEIKAIKLNFDIYLGGICDLTGELIRKATNAAAENNFEEVIKIKNIINGILTELVEFDMAGYLRTKYDQAKNNLKKIEQICYEIKIRA